MKAILEFNLPEEAEEHRTALNGPKYLVVLQELDAKLRNMKKYQNEEVIGVDKVRTMITDLLYNYGVENE